MCSTRVDSHPRMRTAVTSVLPPCRPKYAATTTPPRRTASSCILLPKLSRSCRPESPPLHAQAQAQSSAPDAPPGHMSAAPSTRCWLCAILQAYFCGHDHNLQHLDSRKVAYIVSGAGSKIRAGWAGDQQPAKFLHDGSGQPDLCLGQESLPVTPVATLHHPA